MMSRLLGKIKRKLFSELLSFVKGIENFNKDISKH